MHANNPATHQLNSWTMCGTWACTKPGSCRPQSLPLLVASSALLVCWLAAIALSAPSLEGQKLPDMLLLVLQHGEPLLVARAGADLHSPQPTVSVQAAPAASTSMPPAVPHSGGMARPTVACEHEAVGWRGARRACRHADPGHAVA